MEAWQCSRGVPLAGRRSATHSPPRCQEAEGGGGGGSATTASTKGTLELERRTFEGRDAVDVTLAWYGRGMGGGESVETLGGRARWEGSGRRYKDLEHPATLL